MSEVESFNVGDYAFEKVGKILDYYKPTRFEWRALCRGPERASMQHFLLQIAHAAEAGTHADQLAFYKAAYAVLPLRDQNRLKLTQLLIAERPVPLEWADVLVETLADTDVRSEAFAADILEALGETYSMAKNDRIERRRATWIVRHVVALGFRPNWAVASASKPKSG